MGIIMILLVQFAVPFAELGVVTGLAVKISYQKKRIEQLTEWLKQQRFAALDKDGTSGHGEQETRSETLQQVPIFSSRTDLWTAPGGDEIQATDREGSADREAPADRKVSADRKAPANRKTLEHNAIDAHKEKRCRGNATSSSIFYQGVVALVIKVIFVALAGLIFATIAWHMLPSFCKVIVVFGFAGLFFGTDLLAGRVFEIKRTNQAFYVPGSIFLSLTVLTADYFGLLGPEFMLKGKNRRRVLWAGSIVTEMAMFVGLKNLQDRIYTQACLQGMTVDMAFLVGALKLSRGACTNAMVYYSFLLVTWDAIHRKRTKGDRGEQGVDGMDISRPVLDARLDEGFHSLVPLHFRIFSAVTTFQAVLGFMGAFIGHMIFSRSPITLWSMVGLGMAAVGVVIIALGNRIPLMQTLHNVSLAVFFQYARLGMPMNFTYQLPVGVVLTGVCFLAEKKMGSSLGNLDGEYVLTAGSAVGTALLICISLFAQNETGERLVASASIILLVAVVADWSRGYLLLRGVILFILFFLTATGRIVLIRSFDLSIRYDVRLMAFTATVSAWDVVRRDRSQISVLVIGAGAQAAFWIIGWGPLPFFILLSAYLLAVPLHQGGEMRKWYLRGNCIYFLVGAFIVVGSMAINSVLQMVWVTGVLATEYAIVYYQHRKWANGKFQDTTGVIVLATIMGIFYINLYLALWNLTPCMTSPVVFYTIFYRSGRIWLYLVAILSVLLIPVIAAGRYDVTANQPYALTALTPLATGILSRRYRPVVSRREAIPVLWDMGWFHIPVILIILLVTWSQSRGWSCAYTFLIALYVPQYTPLRQYRKEVYTLALCLMVLTFRRQPFVEWPQVVWLEIQLLPAVVLIRLLSVIREDEKSLPRLQIAFYNLCLTALVLGMFHMGDVADALILEAICLAVFLWTYTGKCIRWVRTSGIIIVTAALYMIRDFWLSLSWWVYLLAAGLGFILFAAVNETKKH